MLKAMRSQEHRKSCPSNFFVSIKYLMAASSMIVWPILSKKVAVRFLVNWVLSRSKTSASLCFTEFNIVTLYCEKFGQLIMY